MKHQNRRVCLFVLFLLLCLGSTSACTADPDGPEAASPAENIAQYDFAPCEDSGERVAGPNPEEALYSGIDAYLEEEGIAFHTVYFFQEGDDYAPGELALDINAVYMTRGDEEYTPALYSGDYQQRHVTVRDLRTGLESAFVQQNDALWVREAGADAWVATAPALAALLADPYYNFWPARLAPQVLGAEAPTMAASETIAGQAATHYCWIPEDLDESYGGLEAFGYLAYWESLYSFFHDVELHAWMAEEDGRLLRLAMTGVHSEDRYWNNFVEHKPEQEYFMWSEISAAGDLDQVQPPADREIALMLDRGDAPREAPTLAIPLPAEATPIDPTRADALLDVEAGDEIPLGDLETEDINPVPYSRREFVITEQEVMADTFNRFRFNRAAAAFLVHETNLSPAEALDFAMTAMPEAGWALDDAAVHVGRPGYWLRFVGGGGEATVVIIREGEPGWTLYYTVDAESLPAESGGAWQHFDATSAGLPDSNVAAIAIDGDGMAWIGTAGGLVVYDPAADNWSEPELPVPPVNSGVRALAVSEDGHALVIFGLSPAQLYMFDGIKWEQNLPGNATAAAFAGDGMPFASRGDFEGEGMYRFEAGQWALDETLQACFGDSAELMASDPAGRLWMSKTWSSESGDGRVSEAGVAVLEGEGCMRVDVGGLTDFIAFDAGGALWLGQSFGNIWRYDPASGESRRLEEQPFEFATGLAVDGQGNLYVASMEGLFFLPDGGEWQVVTFGADVPQPEFGYGSGGLAVDAEGRVWLGARNGLYVFTPAE